MSSPSQYSVSVNGHECRVLKKGNGPMVGYLAGLLGLPRWSTFLDEMALHHTVVAPSLPGFPGADGHEDLDHLVDWISAVLDLLEQAELSGAHLIGSSVGGMLAAEIAALSPGTVASLSLFSPLGLYDDANPIPHIWANRASDINAYLCADLTALEDYTSAPPDADAAEWSIMQIRCMAAGARLLWPTCDLGLKKRLHRIQAPTLLVWGDSDRFVDISYQRRFAEAIPAPASTAVIPGAGHLVEVDQPHAAAQHVTAFLAGITDLASKRAS